MLAKWSFAHAQDDPLRTLAVCGCSRRLRRPGTDTWSDAHRSASFGGARSDSHTAAHGHSHEYAYAESHADGQAD